MERMNVSENNKIHRVYLRFLSLFKTIDGEWKYYGYEFIRSVERWSKYYPDDVHTIRCDDAGHSSSCIVLIENKSDKFWFGITLIMIPQNSGIPCEMFFYDHSTDDMIRILKSIRSKTRKLKRD